MRSVVTAIVLLIASPAWSNEPDIKAIVDTHVLPSYRVLEETTAGLAEASYQDCSADNPALVAAYHDAFDAWVGVSHLRFGPSEIGDRAFALAYWPDPRGSTPKALTSLISAEDAAVASPDAFKAVSIAARGFYALEFLLFDPQFSNTEKEEYHCALVRAVTTDISANASAILWDWQHGYGDLMSMPGNDTYRTPTEAARQLFTALATGLEFTSATRLGRPMGTFDRPRPKRAEARRSERSLRHVVVSLKSTRELAALISAADPNLQQAFDTAIQRAETLDDPVFAGVTDPQGRLRIEVLQQKVDEIRQLLAEDVGPTLGIAAGFNSLDGD